MIRRTISEMSPPLARSSLRRSQPPFSRIGAPHTQLASDRASSLSDCRTMPRRATKTNSERNAARADFDAPTRGQYYHRQSLKCHLDSETRLLLAVLEDAIRCVVLYCLSPSATKLNEVSEAMTWINHRGDRDLFSFDSICQVFEIEPGMLRKQLNSISSSSCSDSTLL